MARTMTAAAPLRLRGAERACIVNIATTTTTTTAAAPATGNAKIILTNISRV